MIRGLPFVLGKPFKCDDPCFSYPLSKNNNSYYLLSAAYALFWSCILRQQDKGGGKGWHGSAQSRVGVSLKDLPADSLEHLVV